MKSTKISLPVWKKNEPLSKYSYIKMGGPADFFTVAKSADELAAAVKAAEKAGIQWFILGGGSNILIGDLGFRGLVIKNEAKKLTVNGERLTAESGVKMAKLAAFANEKGLAGPEMFMSLPGTVGGAIFNNSHYRPERNEFIGNLVEEAEILEGRGKKEGERGGEGLEGREGPDGGNKGIYRNLREIKGVDEREIKGANLKEKGSDLGSGERSDLFSWKRVTVDRDWFRFGYDYSRLQDEKAVVLRVKFRLRKEPPERLRERSLALMKDRNSRQPIGKPSCGCMFKNPNRIEGSDPSRVSAGKLIDEAGMKGAKVGGVSVSQTHANFMVNDGTGKAAGVLELMNRVKTRVKEFHGIELEPEIFFVGEFGSKMVTKFQKTQNTLKAGNFGLPDSRQSDCPTV